MRDGISTKQLKRAISPTYVLDNTPLVSQIIDLQGYDAASFLIAIGAFGDANATVTALLEEGDDSGLSDAAAVADADMVSQDQSVAPEAAASFQFDDDNEVRKLGYIGSKRYIRLTLTPASNSVASPALGLYVAALAVLEHSAQPVIQGAS